MDCEMSGVAGVCVYDLSKKSLLHFGMKMDSLVILLASVLINNIFYKGR